MIRTTIYLSDELHDGLKHLAVEKHQSMADLLRQAVQAVYERELRIWTGRFKRVRHG